MSYSIDVQTEVPLHPWVEMLKKMESKEEPRAIYISESEHVVRSFDLLSPSELKTALSKFEVYPFLVVLPESRYHYSANYTIYYKMSYVVITRTNEGMIEWIRENLQTPVHLKVVKENMVNNLKNGCSLINALKADLIYHDTILNSQLRMHASAVKNRCCIIRIICYMQDFFAKLWSGTLSSFFRYTVFLPLIDIDVWNSRYSIETFRRARKDFANAIVGQFEEELITLIGKDMTVKRWMTDNHPDRNLSNIEKYKQVDELRQRIQEMQKLVATLDNSSAIQQTAPKEAVVPPTEAVAPQEEVAPPAEDQVTPPPADAVPQEPVVPPTKETGSLEAGTPPSQYNLDNVALCPTDMPD